MPNFTLVFDNDKDARLLETKLSYEYQIPQTCWQTDKVSWTKEDIEYIYKNLNTLSQAKKCLEKFGRDINYPLIDKLTEDSSHIHFAKNAITQIYACNLMEDVMEVVVFDDNAKTRKHYSKITNINRSIEKTTVYSLQVANELYFADNILTPNPILSSFASIVLPAINIPSSNVLVDPSSNLTVYSFIFPSFFVIIINILPF